MEFSSGQVGAGTTVHERLIEVMREKKQGPGALASPSGRVHSLEDFLAACICIRVVFCICILKAQVGEFIQFQKTFLHMRPKQVILHQVREHF